MTADSVLVRLQELGVDIEVDLNDVYVSPADKVPDELWAELSRSKLNLFGQLMAQRILSEIRGEDELVERLRSGHSWITQSADQIVMAPDHCEGTDRLPTTMRWSRVWLLLDRHLRKAYRYEGCIFTGASCAALSGLLCHHCQNLREQR